MQTIVYQDRYGAWRWELDDSGDPYMRSENVFATEAEAQADLKNASHLIQYIIEH